MLKFWNTSGNGSAGGPSEVSARKQDRYMITFFPRLTRQMKDGNSGAGS
jgi:hypothetical protein